MQKRSVREEYKKRERMTDRNDVAEKVKGEQRREEVQS